MSTLSDLMVSAVCCAVDFASYAVFKVLAVASIALINVVRVPGAVGMAVLQFVMDRLSILVEYVAECVVDLLCDSLSWSFGLIQESFIYAVQLLGSVAFDLLTSVYHALDAVSDYIYLFLLDLSKMLWMSTLNVCNNFLDALYYFIENL